MCHVHTPGHSWPDEMMSPGDQVQLTHMLILSLRGFTWIPPLVTGEMTLKMPLLSSNRGTEFLTRVSPCDNVQALSLQSSTQEIFEKLVKWFQLLQILMQGAGRQKTPTTSSAGLR